MQVAPSCSLRTGCLQDTLSAKVTGVLRPVPHGRNCSPKILLQIDKHPLHAVGTTAGDLDSLREVRERAQTHDRYYLGIEPLLYGLWLDNAIATSAVCDSQ